MKDSNFLLNLTFTPLQNIYEPRHEKTCFRGFRTDGTQTGL